MTPPTHSKDDEGWRHQALIDVQEDFIEAHKRLRKELDKEELFRKELEKKTEELVKELRSEVKNEFLRKEVFDKAFDPLQRAFYAVIGLVMTTVILAILYLVVKH